MLWLVILEFVVSFLSRLKSLCVEINFRSSTCGLPNCLLAFQFYFVGLCCSHASFRILNSSYLFDLSMVALKRKHIVIWIMISIDLKQNKGGKLPVKGSHGFPFKIRTALNIS